MRKLILIFILLVMVSPALAQDDNFWGAMDSWALCSNGECRYKRFDEYPILVYGNVPSEHWDAILDHAIEQIPLEIERTQDETQADLTIYFVEPDYFVDPATRGAAKIKPVRVGNSWVMQGSVYINYQIALGDDACPLMLHEVLHGLGLRVHSPDSDDIMFSSTVGKVNCFYSQRDLNTLLMLYSKPSLVGNDE